MLYSGSFVSRASGKIGQQVASHNRGGLYLRSQAILTGGSTGKQVDAQDAMIAVNEAWAGTLTEAQRQGWIEWARNVPRRNALGEVIFWSGANAFMHSNALRVMLGDSVVQDAPEIFGLAQPLASVSAAADVGGITFTFTGLAADSFAAFQVGKPVGLGINYFRGPWQVTGRSETSPFAGTFYSPSPTGDYKFWVRSTVVSDNGLVSSPMQAGPFLLSL